MMNLHKRVAHLYMMRKTSSSLTILKNVFPKLAPDDKTADLLLEVLATILREALEDATIISQEIVEGPVQSASISPVYVDESRTPYGYDSDEERDLPNGAKVDLNITVSMRDLSRAVSVGMKSRHTVSAEDVVRSFISVSRDRSALVSLGKVLSDAYAAQYLDSPDKRNINLINSELSDFVLTHGETYNEVLDFSNAKIESYSWKIEGISVTNDSVVFSVKAFGEFDDITFSVEDDGY